MNPYRTLRNTHRTSPWNMTLAALRNDRNHLGELVRLGLATRGDLNRIADLDDELATR